MRLGSFLISIFVLAASLTFAGEASAQNRKKNKIRKTSRTAEQISADERRKVVENLMLQGDYHHDGPGELYSIGTIESVPALLRVLQANPPIIKKIEDEEDLPDFKKPGDIETLSKKPKSIREPQKSYICTYGHAVIALQKITAQRLVDYEDWKNWWEEYLKNKENTN